MINNDMTLVLPFILLLRGVSLSTDVLSHVIHNNGQYISTSTSKLSAKDFPKGAAGYLYEINIQKNAVQVSDVLKSALGNKPITKEEFELYSIEKEMPIPQQIKPQDIRRAWPVEINYLPHEGTGEVIEVRSIGDTFITNPDYAPSKLTLPAEPSLTLKTIRGIGHGATILGVAVDGFNLHEAYQRSKAESDYNKFFREGARVIGGWSGAFAAGTAMAKAGVAACGPLGPYGPPVCGLVGGVAGSIAGYMGGGELATMVFDAEHQPSALRIVDNKEGHADVFEIGNDIEVRSTAKVMRDSAKGKVTGNVLDILEKSKTSHDFTICQEALNTSQCRPLPIPTTIKENILSFIHNQNEQFAKLTACIQQTMFAHHSLREDVPNSPKEQHIQTNPRSLNIPK